VDTNTHGRAREKTRLGDISATGGKELPENRTIKKSVDLIKGKREIYTCKRSYKNEN